MSRKLLWSCGAAVLAWKLLLLALFIHTGDVGTSGRCDLCAYANDTHTYFDPIDAWVRSGTYTPGFRMPGYGIPYLVARILVGPAAAPDLLILLQIALSTLSVIVLAQLAYTLTGSRRPFFLIVVGYPLLLALHAYDFLLLTESFSASALIFLFTLLTGYFRRGGTWRVVLAGVFAMWAVFLKPVCLPIILAGAAVLFIGTRTARWRWKAALAFLLPFLLAEIPWTLQNARSEGGFHPLTRSMYLGSDAPDMGFEANRFVRSFGGSITWWENPRAEIWYFQVYDVADGPPVDPATIELPQAVLALPGAAEELPALARAAQHARDPGLDSMARRTLEQHVITGLRGWRERYEREAPFDHAVTAHLRALRHEVLDQPGCPFAFALPFREMPWWEKIVKLFLRLPPMVLCLAGVLSVLLLLRRHSDHSMRLLLVFLVFFGLFIFPLIYLSEPRYWVCFAPFSVLACCWAWSDRRTTRS